MTSPRRPPGRYDERRPLPRAVLVGGGVLLGLLLVGIAYVAYDRFSGGRVLYGTQGYEVVDDATVRVRFEVRKGVLESVECALEARDRDKTTIGRRTVTVGPSDRELVITTSTVTTTSRATTAEVVGCRTLAP